MKFDYSDENYQQYCTTDNQVEILGLAAGGMSFTDIGDVMGVSANSVSSTLKRIRRNAADSGYIPDSGMTVAFDADLKHTFSTVHVKDGQVIQHWSRLKAGRQVELQKAAIEAFVKHEVKLPKPVKPKQRQYDKDLIPFFQIGDAHIGMLAHEAETGNNFDLKIAERELTKAMFELIDRVPACERCVINDLGDFEHYENMAAKTAKSGHDLDFDTRYGKMRLVAARILRSIIEKALTKFKYVDLALNIGNHNETNSISNAVWLKIIYENEPRVTVLDNISLFITYRMGNTFVMMHHSHTCNHKKLADVMTSDFKEDFGETLYHYIDIGHIHHGMTKKELGQCVIESWNQMAPADKHAADHGWRSRSFLTCVMRSKTYGEKRREIITREEVQDLIAKVPRGTHVTKRRKVHTV